MNFDFGEILTKAWKVIWKHKVLWVFGILAGCGRSSGGNSSSNNGTRYNQPASQLPPQAEQFFQKIAEHATQYIVIGIAIICIIWIIAIFLSTIGKTGLIRGAFQAENGVEHLIFGQLFSESMPYFWRMFGLSLILGLPIFIVTLTLAVLFVAGIMISGGGENTGLAILGLLPIMLGCFCILIPIMFVAGMIFHQAERSVVLEDMQVLPAISRGWEIFKKNLAAIFVMAIILGIINLIIGFVIILPVIAVVFPSVFAFIAGNAQNFTPLIIAGICICLYIPIAWLINGITISYTESAWTLTYMKLTQLQEETPVIIETNA